MNEPPRIRDDLVDVRAYLAPQVEASVRLNTNESSYPLPDSFSEDLAETVRRIPFNRYPDREATALRKGLAEKEGHPVEGLWVGNGSNEVIQHLCLAYGGSGRRALVFEPTYGLHSLIPRITGMELVSARLGQDFVLTPEEARAGMSRYRPAIAFACSPNNPTGNAHLLATIQALCEWSDTLVIVDEAYGEFGGVSSALLLERFRNLVVLKTFSKAYALAAARIGYCLADPAIVGELARVRLPYHLSALTQATGEVALRHTGEAEGVLEAIRIERDRLYSELKKMPAVEAFPSSANFVMFRTPADASSLWQGLLDRGVLVRDVSAAPGCERCLRVTAGKPEETDAFLKALGEALVEERV
ncbi:MAG: histidinol-phosphate transaminase [Actinomycetota bacterium]